MDATTLRKFWSLILAASPDGLAEVSETAFVSTLSTYINDSLCLSSKEQRVLINYLQAKRQLILDILVA